MEERKYTDEEENRIVQCVFSHHIREARLRAEEQEQEQEPTATKIRKLVLRTICFTKEDIPNKS